jgi:hypothetical protein
VKEQRLHAAWRRWASLDSPHWHADVNSAVLPELRAHHDSEWIEGVFNSEAAILSNMFGSMQAQAGGPLPAMLPSLPCKLRLVALLAEVLATFEEEVGCGMHTDFSLAGQEMVREAVYLLLTTQLDAALRLDRRWPRSAEVRGR